MSADLHFSDDELSELQDAFELFDKDGDGSITREEMSQVMRGFGQSVDSEVLRPLFTEVDDNGDGSLQWDEFVSLIRHLDPSRADHRALHRSLVIFLEIRGR